MENIFVRDCSAAFDHAAGQRASAVRDALGVVCAWNPLRRWSTRRVVSIPLSLMGQYFKAINVTKQEVVCPWCLDTGAKLWEWAANPLAAVFTLLLRKSDCSGGGDYYGYKPKAQELTGSAEKDAEQFSELMTEITAKEGAPAHPAPDTVVGRWAGDEVYLVGDYDSSKLYDEARSYRNISRELADEWNDFIELKELQLKYRPDCSCQ